MSTHRIAVLLAAALTTLTLTSCALLSKTQTSTNPTGTQAVTQVTYTPSALATQLLLTLPQAAQAAAPSPWTALAAQAGALLMGGLGMLAAYKSVPASVHTAAIAAAATGFVPTTPTPTAPKA
jgi:hypothetical protein